LEREDACLRVVTLGDAKAGAPQPKILSNGAKRKKS